MNIRIMAVACLAAAWSVRADTNTWSPTSGTLFQEASNWSLSAVPGAADTAVFSGSNTYAVTFNGNVTNAGATIGSPVAGTSAVFDLNGWLWKLTGTLGFGTAGTATFGGGALEVSNAVAVNANQKLVLNGDTSVFSTAVTTSGGTVEVGGGRHVFGPSVPDANASGKGLFFSTASLSGGPSFRVTNGIVSVTAALNALENYTFNISLEGGILRNESGAYGVVMEGPGTLDVRTNAIFETRGTRCYFGRRKGLSSLNILGGAVSNDCIAHIGSAYAPGSTSVVNLVDGIFYSSNTMGFGGTSGTKTNAVGILSQSGGRVRMASVLQFGYGVGSVGIYTQSGGTAWCSQLRLGNNNGSGSQGLVYLAGGTLALNSNPYLGNGVGCTGCIYQTGGELLVSNGMDLAVITNSFGLYHYKGGKARVNGSVSVGSGALSVGRMVVEGPELSVLGNLNVASGVSSTGEVVVAGGSLVCPSVQFIAKGANSVGRMCVTGGQLSCSNELQVGCAAGAFGGVYLTNGVLASYGDNYGYRLGYVSGATGELVVAGGQLTAMNYYSIIAGYTAGAYGSVTISGGTNDIRSLRIGHMGGKGLMRITGGQTYVTNEVGYFFTFGNVAVTPLARFELAGGVLTTRAISGGGYGYTESLFDGGVLQCACDNASFFQDFNLASLTDRGAVVDTAGYSATVAQTLTNEAGYAGSFTKRGAGKLTLSSALNTFTGRVTVEAGELSAGSSGRIYLNGGAVIEAGAVLNLSSGALRGFTTSPGTVSRIDGALILRAIDGTLTNGVGATLCGGGVVTGSVVFAAGSAWGHDKAWGVASAGPLRVTGSVVLEEGVTVALTGYSVDDLKAGIPLLQAAGTGTLRVPGLIPVTLDGASHRYWWAKVSSDGKTLTAAFVPMGTMIRLL